MCVVKATHVCFFPNNTNFLKCLVKTTHVLFFPNIYDVFRCWVKTTHVCEKPTMLVISKYRVVSSVFVHIFVYLNEIILHLMLKFHPRCGHPNLYDGNKDKIQPVWKNHTHKITKIMITITKK